MGQATETIMGRKKIIRKVTCLWVCAAFVVVAVDQHKRVTSSRPNAQKTSHHLWLSAGGVWFYGGWKKRGI